MASSILGYYFGISAISEMDLQFFKIRELNLPIEIFVFESDLPTRILVRPFGGPGEVSSL